MPICPACHSQGPHRYIGRSDYLSSSPLLIGVALAKRRLFQCGSCGQKFPAHTLASGLSLVFLLLLLCSPLLIWLFRVVVYALHR